MPACPELSLRLPNSPGALAAVCRELAVERIQILALSLETGGTLRLIVDNHVRALGVLKARHHSLTSRDVVVASVTDAEMLAATLDLVAASGVNVEYSYLGAGSVGPVAVLGVDNAQRAAAAAGV